MKSNKNNHKKNSKDNQKEKQLQKQLLKKKEYKEKYYEKKPYVQSQKSKEQQNKKATYIQKQKQKKTQTKKYVQKDKKKYVQKFADNSQINNQYNANFSQIIQDFTLMVSKNSKKVTSQNLMMEVRNLKKIFLKLFKNVKNLNVKYSTTHPCVFLQYEQNGKNKIFLIRNLIKCNIQLRNKDLILSIYDNLYSFVQKKFIKIQMFGLKKAQEFFIGISRKTLQLNQQNPLFYFVVESKKLINFSLFDSNLVQISFDTKYIQSKSKLLKSQHQIYKQFYKYINEQEQQNEDRDIFMNQQIQSNQDQNEKYEGQELKKTQKRLHQILNKNFQEFRNRIQQKKDILNDYIEDEKIPDDKIQRLEDQVYQMEMEIQNYNDARQKVKQTLSEVNKHSHNYKKMVSLCLKKMIMAQKQMESRLPILTKKNEIFQLLNKRNLIILEGQTGSGKSTQLPQLLCEYYKIFDDPYAKPVLVTQPRRLATRTLAERVAFQMEEKVRGFVDYAASADREINPRAKIIFKLDRLVLDELTIDQTLSKYSCMVIDEAHERTISIDVILGLVKKLLQLRKDFKIIVTSASMDTQLFKKYFRTDILKVSGRLYPVDIFYKDYRQDNTVRKVYKVITEQILNENMAMKENYKGHVLVFCSGVDQINELYQMFRKLLNPHIFKVYALHGKIAPQQQKQVFLNTKQYKIIFASRIAQTAITIDGVRVVIDPGQDRELVYDQKNKISSWKLQKISQSSAKQRAGRAGRTRAGFCFRLYSENSFKKDFRPNKVPQIENMALDTLVLRLKSLNIDNVVKFPYISPPNEQGLKISIQTMKMIGCLNQQQKITEIGKLLIKIPIQPFLSRAIAEAMMFEFIQNDQRFWKQLNVNQNSSQIKTKWVQKGTYNIVPVIPHYNSSLIGRAITASQNNINNKILQNQPQLKKLSIVKIVIQILCMVINSSNLFIVRQDQRQQCQKIKFQQFKDSNGDFFFFRNIYNKYLSMFQNKDKGIYRWACDHYLNLKTLHQVRQLQNEVSQTVRFFRFDFKNIQNQLNKSKSKLRSCITPQDMILSTLLTSFCTNLCLYSGNTSLGYTLLSQRKPLQIYGTSTLSLQGITPRWIVCFDLITNQKGNNYCKVAHQVNYSLIINSIDEYVFKKFQLQKAKDLDLFYQKKIYSNIPSLILKEVAIDYKKRQDINFYPFLKKLSLFVNEDLNRLEFYYLKQSKSNNIKIIDQQIKNYIENKKNNYKLPYRHNFIANTVISMIDGCKIQSIQLFNCQTKYTLILSQDICLYIQQCCYSYCIIEKYQIEKNKIKMIVTIEQKQNTFYFQNLIRYYGFTQYTKQFIDKQKKTPFVKIFLRFYCGRPKEKYDHIYASYEDQPDNSNPAKRVLKILTQNINKVQKKFNLKNYRIVLAAKQKGINFYPKQNCRYKMDEFYLMEQLIDIKQNYPQIFSYNFPLPKSCKMFRLPERPYCTTTDEQWKLKIKKLMDRIGIEDKNPQIRVWGYYNPEKIIENGKQKKISKFEESFRVDMHAQIKTSKIQYLKKLKQEYHGKQNILGCQKVYLKFQFQQTVAIVKQKVFRALEDEYYYQVDKFKSKYLLISFDCFNITKRLQQFRCIKVRSSHREHLLEPIKVIGKLFSPKYIHLGTNQLNFLNKSRIGSQILDQIEYYYHYTVYFLINREKQRMVLYCDDHIQSSVEKKLLQEINKYKYLEERISYRGKNLNQVKKILQQNIKQIAIRKNKQQFIQYQIIFQTRQIKITADFYTLQNVKNQINKIIQCGKPQCSICNSVMIKPYKLFNCQHQFCIQCISNCLSCFKIKGNLDGINCPQQKCQNQKKSINIYDLKAILTEEDFHKICDSMTKKYVQTNSQFHICFTSGCQQIFLVKQSTQNNNFQCDICGKWYCYKCKFSHKNYTCKEWKKKIDQLEEDLVKFGIKKCPKCNEGIQKNQGCQKIQCLRCKAIICWNCLKTFQNSQQCYTHLKQECGGIYKR